MTRLLMFLKYLLALHLIADFSDANITVQVPRAVEGTGVQTYEIPEFNIVDDNIDEVEQSFAIVAEIGPDVPENISCFQTDAGTPVCHGRRGATKIRIFDNDRKGL